MGVFLIKVKELSRYCCQDYWILWKILLLGLLDAMKDIDARITGCYVRYCC